MPPTCSHPIHLPGFPLRTFLLIGLTVLSAWLMAALVVIVPPGEEAWAREKDDSIFRRFSEKREHISNRFRLFEVPVAIRPQTNADAEIQENLGFGYVQGFFPRNPIFISFGISAARLEWLPEDPEITSVNVKQFDLTQSLNFRIKRLFVLSFGLGLGIMDGLVLYPDGTFDHQLLPYIPVQFGAVVPMGDTLLLSLRAVHTPFFGSGDVIGHSRVVLGLGYYY